MTMLSQDIARRIERTILMSAPMVLALLAGTKTQTRRIVKPQPIEHVAFAGGAFIRNKRLGEIGIDALVAEAMPYGAPGDRLWVRETWASHANQDHLPPRELNKAVRFYEVEHGQQRGLNPRVGKKRPGMFMPRWHSRITLEVTGVRVERLQDISEADAMAEGVNDHHNITDPTTGEIDREAVDAYQELWESINGPGSWDANPWVWVVEFRKMA